VGLGNGYVSIADFLPNHRADRDFARLDEGDFSVLLGGCRVKRSGEPIFDGIGQRLTRGVFGHGLEFELATNRRGGLRRSYLDADDLGGLLRLFLPFLRAAGARKQRRPGESKEQAGFWHQIRRDGGHNRSSKNRANE